jgi:pimeloyl-ACP methyl ester carboxylesterase
MSPSDWLASGQFHPHAGNQIFYRTSGSGQEAILMLHGFPTASWDWHKICPMLEKDFRLIALDMLGYGFSSKPINHAYSFKEQADIIESLLQVSEITHCHILAHDYGDTVAQELIARQLEDKLSFSITSVCLLNGGIFPEAHSRRPIQKMLLGPLGFLIGKLSTKSTLRRNFHNIFGPKTPASEDEINSFWSLMNYNKGKRVIHLLIQYLHEREEYRERWVDALQRCPVPLKLINGNFDPISGKQMSVRFSELVERPDIVDLPDIGHYPQTEAPELVLKHYVEFLGQGS